MIDRNAIADALFALVQAAPGFVYSSRRLQMWGTSVAQPAVFLRMLEDNYEERPARGMPAKVRMEAEIFIYYYTADKDEAPGIMLDTLVGNVEAAIAPVGPFGPQTLGGLVSHCCITGRVMKDDGALTGQAIAKIPIEIVTTS